MSFKEIIMIPKHKFEELNKEKTIETKSQHTQTDEEDSDKNVYMRDNQMFVESNTNEFIPGFKSLSNANNKHLKRLKTNEHKIKRKKWFKLS